MGVCVGGGGLGTTGPGATRGRREAQCSVGRAIAGGVSSFSCPFRRSAYAVGTECTVCRHAPTLAHAPCLPRRCSVCFVLPEPPACTARLYRLSRPQDVATFLAWAAEPEADERKLMGAKWLAVLGVVSAGGGRRRLGGGCVGGVGWCCVAAGVWWCV